MERKFEYEKRVLKKKIEDGRHWGDYRIMAFSITSREITLRTDDIVPISVLWDGKTLDFINKN